jgi:hypothetical protein
MPKKTRKPLLMELLVVGAFMQIGWDFWMI